MLRARPILALQMEALLLAQEGPTSRLLLAVPLLKFDDLRAARNGSKGGKHTPFQAAKNGLDMDIYPPMKAPSVP